MKSRLSIPIKLAGAATLAISPFLMNGCSAPPTPYLNADNVTLPLGEPPRNTLHVNNPATPLLGTDGADALWGAATGGRMAGGKGDDVYHIVSIHDVVEERPGEGVDTIVSPFSWTLPANVENLQLTRGDTYGEGNDQDNILIGGEGTQTLEGKGGNDILIGGAGRDIFVFNRGSGHDVVEDFVSGEDAVRLPSVSFDEAAGVADKLSATGPDTTLDLSKDDRVVFRKHAPKDFAASDFQLGLDLSKFRLTFSDEFDTLRLADDHGAGGIWTTQYGYGGLNSAASRGISEQAQQMLYTDPTFNGADGRLANPINPFSVHNGVLTITARPLSNDERTHLWNQKYASGMLTTRSSFSQKYGYFEIRARLPKGAGFFPAFWLLPSDGSWPPEIDVFEQLAKEPNKIYMSQHTKQFGRPDSVTNEAVAEDASATFHTYGTLWDPIHLTWFVDGVEAAQVATPTDLTEPMFLLVNLAVGGEWGGPADGVTTGTLEVDYVRAYARK